MISLSGSAPFAARYHTDDTWHRATTGVFSVLTECAGGWSLHDRYQIADAPPEGAKLCGVCWRRP